MHCDCEDHRDGYKYHAATHVELVVQFEGNALTPAILAKHAQHDCFVIC